MQLGTGQWRRATWRAGLTALAVAGMLATPYSASAQRKDPALPRLTFRFEKPRTVTVYPGRDTDRSATGIPKAGRVYWYLPYTLTNEGKTAGEYFVSLRATSDKGRRYSDLALPYVEKKIERMERRPLQSKVDLLQKGEKLSTYQSFTPGQKRDCVAIFNPIDPEADVVVLDVYGLLNDIEVEDLGGGKFKIHERALRIVFERPGDEFFPSLDEFKLKSKEWIKVTTETSISK